MKFPYKIAISRIYHEMILKKATPKLACSLHATPDIFIGIDSKVVKSTKQSSSKL